MKSNTKNSSKKKYTKLRQCIYSRTVNVIMTYIKDKKKKKKHFEAQKKAQDVRKYLYFEEKKQR